MGKAQWKMDSTIGPLYLVASNQGLQGVFWKEQAITMAKSLKVSQLEITILANTIAQLEEYFQGTRKSFDLPLDVIGTDFQKRVWGQLSQIPYGETYSYRDIAQKINNQGAVRAVGTANAKNPLSIIVPCHRVIAANGSLAGYAGGLSIKSKLLDLERKVSRG